MMQYIPSHEARHAGVSVMVVGIDRSEFTTTKPSRVFYRLKNGPCYETLLREFEDRYTPIMLKCPVCDHPIEQGLNLKCACGFEAEAISEAVFKRILDDLIKIEYKGKTIEIYDIGGFHWFVTSKGEKR